MTTIVIRRPPRPPKRKRIFALRPTIYNVSVAEAASASDVVSSLAVFPSSVTEAGSATDTVSSLAVFPSSVSESGSASDSVSSVGTFPSSVSESGSATDTDSAAAVFANSFTETGTATDSSDTAGSIYGISVAESGSAADSGSSSAIFGSAITETNTANDSGDALGAFGDAIVEAATAADSEDGTVVTPGGGTTYAATVLEGVSWNVADKSDHVFLADDNLTATTDAAGASANARATRSHSTGKWYFEATILFDASGGCGLGIVNNSAPLDGNFLSDGAYGLELFSDGSVWLNTANVFNFSSATAVILQFALDASSGLLWVRPAGQDWNNDGSADPATGVGGLDVSVITGAIFPAVGLFAAGDEIVGSFNSRSFTYPIPSGFSAWDDQAAYATDLFSSAAIFASSVTETGVATDTGSALLTLGASIVESATAADSGNSAAVFASSVSETASALDLIAGGIFYSSSVGEAASASDAIFATRRIAARIARSVAFASNTKTALSSGASRSTPSGPRTVTTLSTATTRSTQSKKRTTSKVE